MRLRKFLVKSIDVLFGAAAAQHRMPKPHKLIHHRPAQAARRAGNDNNEPRHKECCEPMLAQSHAARKGEPPNQSARGDKCGFYTELRVRCDWGIYCVELSRNDAIKTTDGHG